MANSFITNKRTTVLALRAAEAAPYLTVGAKAYFGNQLAGKRDGETREFVIRDAGKYVKGKDITGQGSDLVERKVTKTIQLGNVMVQTDLVERETDLDWDVEVAQPQAQALVEGMVQDIIKEDIGQVNTAFVGKGWLPLSKASRFLGSISSEKKYAFIDPMIDSIMSSNGKSFTPAESEPLYRTGMLGNFAGAEYREQQFLPDIDISEDLANELSSATVSGIDVTNAGYDVIKLSGVTETIPAGTPIFIEGVYATNLIGNKTSSLKAFVAIEDAASGSVKVAKTDFAGQGTKEACKKDGSAFHPYDDINGHTVKSVNSIKAGHYFLGLFRINGAFEMESLDKLDWSNADVTSDSVEGIKIHVARAVNVEAGTNKTRFAVPYIAGVVEKRGATLVLIKDTDVNLVTL